MNENEKNNIGDSEQGQPEEAQAFNWEWTDGEAASKDADEHPSKAPTEDPGNEEPKQEETKWEEPQQEDPQQEEPQQEEPQQEDPQPHDPNNTNNEFDPITDDISSRSESGQKIGKAHIAASILSACSILLLVAFALSLITGIFPLNGREAVIIGVSSNGETVPNTDASPELIENFLHSVVVVTARTETGISTGTGVIFSKDGYILTNYHVVEDSDAVAVQLYNEDIAVKAEIIGFHRDDDVAVLKIERTGLRAAAFADSQDVRYGEKVYAIGNPEGSEFSWSVTQGIVSCPLRELMIYDSEGVLEKKMTVVQTDASVNHGNSGGPIINVRGEVVGVVTLKRADSAGMGFALPSSGVLIDVAAIIDQGHANNVNSGISLPRPLLGVTGVGVKEKTYYQSYQSEAGTSIKEVTEEYAKANPSKTFYAAVGGVYVSATSPGFDAASNLKSGDIITEINGRPVTVIYDIMDVVNKFNGGDKVTITYYRNGKYSTVELTLKTSKDLK